MDLKELISLADKFLTDKSNPDSILDNLEKYAMAFEEWFSAIEPALKSDTLDSGIKLEMQGLLDKHEFIVKRTEELQTLYPVAMRDLRKKSKGIMAYTDNFPQKISVTKVIKG